MNLITSKVTRFWQSAIHRQLCILISIFLISGCSQHLAKPIPRLIEQAYLAGFIQKNIDSPPFTLFSLYKNTSEHTETIHIYIEGDGFAWRNRFTPSTNPTPNNPVGLQLALLDSADAVLYLARPCQFVPIKTQPACTNNVWTSARYSEQTIDILNNAIDTALSNYQHKPRIILFGYSGGGSIAALLSARRDDIEGLVTIAANLDHQAWTNYHNDTPLTDSLNPIAIAQDIKAIPQIHMIGNADTVIPVSISRSFINQQSAHKHTKLDVISGYDHRCCWTKNWPKHLTDIRQQLTNLAK